MGTGATPFQNAGLIAALIDTACGFAAVTVDGAGVLAAHFSVNGLCPAQGEHFRARVRVVKAGKTQIFTACDLFAVASQQECRRDGIALVHDTDEGAHGAQLVHGIARDPRSIIPDSGMICSRRGHFSIKGKHLKLHPSMRHMPKATHRRDAEGLTDIDPRAAPMAHLLFRSSS